MSPATSIVSGSIRRSADLSSSGMTIPTQAFPCQIPRRDHKDGLTTRQVSQSRSTLGRNPAHQRSRPHHRHRIDPEGGAGRLFRRRPAHGRRRGVARLPAEADSGRHGRGGAGAPRSSSRRVSEKNCAMAEPSPELESAAIADGLTEDRWLGGRLTLLQPRRGHRVGTDAALLVAAAGDARQGRIVDVGAGVGAVGLALAKRYRARLRRSRRDRSRTGAARREQRGAQRASGARAGPAARRARPGASAARPGSRRIGRVASSPTRRSSSRERSAPLPTKAGRARMSCRARRPARRSATGFPPRSRFSRRAGVS